MSENVCRGPLQTWITWLFSADCAPPAVNYIGITWGLSQDGKLQTCALPWDVAGRAWVVVSRTCSRIRKGRCSSSGSLLQLRTPLSYGNVCLLQLALPQELPWASPFFHIIVFREVVHKGKNAYQKGWRADPWPHREGKMKSWSLLL